VAAVGLKQNRDITANAIINNN